MWRRERWRSAAAGSSPRRAGLLQRRGPGTTHPARPGRRGGRRAGDDLGLGRAARRRPMPSTWPTCARRRCAPRRGDGPRPRRPLAAARPDAGRAAGLAASRRGLAGHPAPRPARPPRRGGASWRRCSAGRCGWPSTACSARRADAEAEDPDWLLVDAAPVIADGGRPGRHRSGRLSRPRAGRDGLCRPGSRPRRLPPGATVAGQLAFSALTLAAAPLALAAGLADPQGMLVDVGRRHHRPDLVPGRAAGGPGLGADGRRST